MWSTISEMSEMTMVSTIAIMTPNPRTQPTVIADTRVSSAEIVLRIWADKLDLFKVKYFLTASILDSISSLVLMIKSCFISEHGHWQPVMEFNFMH
jgi:hypothetical protein